MAYKYFMGIDTSLSATNMAMLDSDDNKTVRASRPILYPQGGGYRPNDIILWHTKQIPRVMHELFDGLPGRASPSAVGVAAFPTRAEDSYEPCFMAGVTAAEAICQSQSVPMFHFSHREGHIAAVLYGANRDNLFYRPFIALHYTGGATECLLVNRDEHSPLFIDRQLAHTGDLHAGQLIERVGQMLGLSSSGYRELEMLSHKCEDIFDIKPVFARDGISFSGVENQCRAMWNQGRDKSDIARYCIEYIIAAAGKMIERAKAEVGDLPIVCSGGVFAGQVIKRRLQDRYKAVLALPHYCEDNAIGIATLTKIEAEKRWNSSQPR